MTKLTLEQLCEKIKENKKTLVLCHKNPDPDTLGSAGALKEILSYFGSEVRIGCVDEPSERISFIVKNEKISYNGTGEEFERIICVDMPSDQQLGEIAYLKDRTDITIDHHAMSTRFSDYYEDFCPACAQIMYDVSKELGIFDKMDGYFYSALYSGISGDTGCFKYSSVTPKTMRAGADIIEKGIDFSEINRRIFDCKSLGEIRAQTLSYANVKMYCDNRLAILTVTNKMKEEYSVTNDDIFDVVNYARQINGVLVAVSLKQSEKEENKFSVSSRANCDIDVSKACAKIGGGGHMRAAGATLCAENPEEAEKKIVEIFSESVNEYGR